MARVLASRTTRCGCCGQVVAADGVTDFGNGLQLRATERGVEYRVMAQGEVQPGFWWTPGITLDDLAAWVESRR
jgi:hypothetical protein